MKPQHPQLRKLGAYGEKLACHYLQKRGFTILNTNWRIRNGEIDIVGLDSDTLVFVEVKTRIGYAFGTPEEAVTVRKIHDIIRTAQFYIASHPHLPEQIRIDVIAVDLSDDGVLMDLRYISNVTG